MLFEIEESSVMVASAERAIGHREQMSFIDAAWDRGAQSLGNTLALKPTNGILIASRGEKEKSYI